MAADYKEDIVHQMDFDSHIAPPPGSAGEFEFQIELRILLQQLNPENGKATGIGLDYNKRKFPIRRWNHAAWLRFQDEYVKQVLAVWDNAYILIPPKDYNGFVWPAAGKRRNLRCRLKITLTDSMKYVHAVIKVVQLAASSGGFRSDSGSYSSEAIVPKTHHMKSEPGITWKQHTPAHEVGHLLIGELRGHINEYSEACQAHPNSDPCYGTDLLQRMNVMGAGDKLNRDQASPWKNRIREHVNPYTKLDDWQVTWASESAQDRGFEGFEMDAARRKKEMTSPLIDYP